MDIIQQLLKLVRINTRISALHSSAEIMTEIMTEAMSLTGTAAAFMLRVAPDRTVECLARFGDEAQWSSSSALEAVDAGRLVYSTRARESSTAPSIVLGNIQTLISAPIPDEGPGAVVLQLVGLDTTSIDPQMLTLLNLFISQVQVTTAKTRLEEAALRHAALAATGELAAQVAHDIRAPLAALEAAAADLAALPAERRALVEGALGRIRDVAEGLLRRESAAGAPARENLAAVVEPVLREKALRHRGLRLDSRLDAAVHARVQAVELARLVSNLVDNAAEALPGGAGRVEVTLSASGGSARLSVRDEGKGIPAELLPRLGRRGETHGKDGGTGLGLHHARERAEAWGGTLEIRSAPGAGTTVTLVLPEAADLAACDAVLVDDDALVRRTWELAAARAGKRLRSFASVDALLGAAPGLDRALPVYVDSDLGGGVRGEQEALKLHALGFRELYVATGRDPGAFSGLSHLKGVRGKTPPWTA
jgi:signal transduction histidine kinase